MKIVDDSGSDIEDLIHTAEKTEGKVSAVQSAEKKIETQEANIEESKPSESSK